MTDGDTSRRFHLVGGRDKGRRSPRDLPIGEGRSARRCDLGACTIYVDPADRYVCTYFRDGAQAVSRPRLRGVPWCSEEQADTYAETAVALGYPDTEEGVVRMALEHDPLHTYLSVLLDRDESPVLRAEASKTSPHANRAGDVLGFEERLVQAVQLALNTGRETEPLALLWWLGYEPESLFRVLRAWLDGEGWGPC